MDDWENLCPLCILPLSEEDKQFRPCKCGYQMCVWCWHTIVTMAEFDSGHCPNCRELFDVASISKAKAKLSRPARKGAKDKAPYLEQSINDRRVVGIRGIPSSLCDPTILSGFLFLGQYGRIVSMFVPHNVGSAVVRFASTDEASTAVKCINGTVLRNSTLSASLVTTKYCSQWLKNTPCTKKYCTDLHQVVTDKSLMVSGAQASTLPVMGAVKTFGGRVFKPESVVSSLVDQFCDDSGEPSRRATPQAEPIATTEASGGESSRDLDGLCRRLSSSFVSTPLTSSSFAIYNAGNSMTSNSEDMWNTYPEEGKDGGGGPMLGRQQKGIRFAHMCAQRKWAQEYVEQEKKAKASPKAAAGKGQQNSSSRKGKPNKSSGEGVKPPVAAPIPYVHPSEWHNGLAMPSTASIRMRSTFS